MMSPARPPTVEPACTWLYAAPVDVEEVEEPDDEELELEPEEPEVPVAAEPKTY